MPPRFFIPQVLVCGDAVVLPDAQAHHVRVLRLELGATLTLFNGEGGEYQARLCELSKRAVCVQIVDFLPRECELPFRLVLAQGVAGGDKMDWLIEKAVELGVTAIQPLQLERCVVRLNAERAARRLEHWQALVRAACEQSGRNRVPEVCPLLDLNAWLSLSPHQPWRFVLSPSATVSLSVALKQGGESVMPESITLLVGPEGGLTDEEEARVVLAGLRAVHLGQRVLRCETAGLVAAAVSATVLGAL